jgi:succinate dehydrogenase/fumarate reductase flavoprotein subunit
VVCGAGMGGLVAAVAAAEDGATVTVLEKGVDPGGSLALSGGYVWTLPSMAEYARLIPHGDQALGRALVEDFETGVEWLRDRKVRLGQRHEELGPDRAGFGYRIEPDPVLGAVQPLLESLQAAGGTVRCRARVVGLELDPDGAVVGVRVRDAGGRETIGADAVVLATGGFQGDVELMSRHVSPWADRGLLRASASCTGDGFRLALDAGAATSGGLNAAYAHVMPALPGPMEPAAFRPMTQFYVEECILLNLRGLRFVDESRGDAACGLELLRQPEAMGFIVLDDAALHSRVMETFIPDLLPHDPLQAVRTAGGTVLRADSLEELGAQLSAHGVPPSPALGTVAAFDAAAAAGDAGALPVPRARGLHACRTAPFYAVRVIPGVTFTEGGIRADAQGRALDRDGRQVPGLFVAGVDVGNISNVGYAGALSAALVTGLRAGVYAARSREGAGAR